VALTRSPTSHVLSVNRHGQGSVRKAQPRRVAATLRSGMERGFMRRYPNSRRHQRVPHVVTVPLSAERPA